MPTCVPPKCDRKPGVNPWNAFLRSGLGSGLTNAQRKVAYAKYKKDMLAQVGYMAAVRGPVWTQKWTPTPPKDKVLTPTPDNHHSNSSVDYIPECDIPDAVLAFFRTMFAIDVRSKKVSPCQAVGTALLPKCVSPSEASHYSFDKVLGIGLNGFVFECLYKEKERRAVKLVIISKKSGDRVNVDGKKKLHTMTERQVRQEFKMHRDLGKTLTRSSGFNVLKLYGRLAIFTPPLYSKYRIGVYIMQSLPTQVCTLMKDMDKAEGRMTPAIRKKVGAIPRVIAEIQKRGYAHSDLHSGNIAFDPKNPGRPFVLDFGRTIHLESTFKESTVDKAIFSMIDYTIPLLVLLSPTTDDIAAYNTVVAAMRVKRELEMIPRELRELFREIFSPVEDKTVVSRTAMINKLLSHARIFHNDTATFFDIVDPQ